jgi:hypothetical protein
MIGVVLDVANASELSTIEHSFGIILRSCMLDCITLSEVIHHSDELCAYTSKEKQKEVYLTANTDQLKFLIKRLEKLKKCEEQKQLKLSFDPDFLVKNILTEYSEYFSDVPNKKFKYDKKKDVVRSVIWISQSERFKGDGALMLELWEHYSRYEHYGPLSFELMQISGIENWNRMVLVLMFVTHLLSYIFAIFIKKDTSSNLSLKSDELRQLMVKLI